MPLTLPFTLPATLGPDSVASSAISTSVGRFREPLYQTPRPDSWPRGVESIIHYGDQAEWTMNDTRRVDAIIVTGIGGLGGPDLSVTADEGADRDGESPNDPRYGGRTITLTGYVSAGNLEMMRHLVSYIETAFDDVREQPLWLRWLDWRDTFQNSQAMIDYAYDEGPELIVATDGSGLYGVPFTASSIVVNPTGSRGEIPSRLTYGDGEATLAFAVSTSPAGCAMGVELRRASATYKIRVAYDYDASAIRVQTIAGGAPVTVASTFCSPLAAGIYNYLVVRAEGSKISYSLWLDYPDSSTASPSVSGSYTLSGPEMISFPPLASGCGWGLRFQPNSADDRILLLDVGAINKGDAVINCRKAVPIEFTEEQATGQFRRSFMVTLRSSSSRMTSRKPTMVTIVPVASSLIFPLGGSGLIFPSDGSGLVFGAYLDTPLINLGRSPASMVVRMTGGMVNPVIIHPVTGKSLGVNGTITPGDFVEFNTERRTVVNSLGISVYGSITDETSWPELLPGSNILGFGSDSAPTGVITITYRHSSR